MKLSELRKILIQNEFGMADKYKSWLASNCSDDCDLDTNFENEDYSNLLSFWKDISDEYIFDDESTNRDIEDLTDTYLIEQYQILKREIENRNLGDKL